MIRQRFDRIVQKLELNQAPIRLNRSLFVGVRTKREKRGQIPLYGSSMIYGMVTVKQKRPLSV